jgi:hypothetical protein
MTIDAPCARIAAVLVFAVAADRMASTATVRVSPPPKVLNIVRQKLKPGTAPAYANLEATIVRGFDRARIPLYWIALQSVKNPADILYLNVYKVPADADRAARTYTEAMKSHPELVRLQQRLSSFGQAAPVSTLTTGRDEFVFSRHDVDLTTMEALRVIVLHVRAGHEGEFVDAAQTGRGVPWLMYEDTASSTFFIVSPLRSTSDRKGGTLPRTLRRLKGVYTAEKPVVYAVRHAMSHASSEFTVANPRYRRSTNTH